MKKFYLLAAMAVATLATNAQEKLFLSTYNGTNIEKFDGKVCDVSVSRLVFKGWNTISLPFSVSESELNETFGSDCKLEKLIGAQAEGSAIRLNFQDCKAAGMQANTPYILYYSGETTTKKISKEAFVSNEMPSLSFNVAGTDETVTMAGVKTKTDGAGFYGILAIDNGDAKFVKVDQTTNGFYATRCYVQLSSGNNKTLVTRHIAAGETTTIDAITSSDERVDVFTLAGKKVASQVPAADVNKMQPNIYIIKGQKVLVK